MSELSFELLIKNTSTQKGEERVHCQRLLRTIEGRREVYDGLWDNRQVIVKLFFDKVHSSRHLRREWKGLQTLRYKGLGSPLPLFKGDTEGRKKAVVIEKIVDSSTVLDVFNITDNKEKQLELLAMVSRELAKHHNKGVIQKDLHLDNFLIRGEELFALDVGQMCFVRGHIGHKKGIKKLALLMYAFLEEDEPIEKICKEYIKTRGWMLEKSDTAFFKKQMIREQKRGLRRVSKKYLRTNKKHLKIATKGCYGVFDREFVKKIEPVEFTKNVDQMMDKGEILKNGNTCYVSRFDYGDNDLVIKRYNYMGILHSFRHTLKGSRAKKCWIDGLWLRMLKIATPQPLAYFEKRNGPFLLKSYIVTEYIEGMNLYEYLQEGERSEHQHSVMMGKVEELLDRLSKHRITHGDLKHTNILITNKGPVLTDLDGMIMHNFSWGYKLRSKKDSNRLRQG
ncbi:MAG: lipopolysaccharide kinase InaA family protein [Planctomycetota bacterium]|jgi:tRNA A-37 threonylcarbamoyl transferase component Bud32